jgi:hypothetical protein
VWGARFWTLQRDFTTFPRRITCGTLRLLEPCDEHGLERLAEIVGAAGIACVAGEPIVRQTPFWKDSSGDGPEGVM